MTTGPLCRWCGKPIRKATTIHTFASLAKTPRPGELPQTRTDAQRLVNMQIVSVERWVSYKDPHDGLPSGDADAVKVDLGIRAVGVWDGESYSPVAGFFLHRTLRAGLRPQRRRAVDVGRQRVLRRRRRSRPEEDRGGRMSPVRNAAILVREWIAGRLFTTALHLAPDTVIALCRLVVSQTDEQLGFAPPPRRPQ